MSGFRTLDDAGDLRGKRALVRVDLNVPMENGRVTDATRIDRILPTIRERLSRLEIDPSPHEVVALLVRAGVAVHEARRRRPRLEELFARLTEGAP